MSKLIHGAVPEGLDRIKTKDKEVSPEGEEGQLMWAEMFGPNMDGYDFIGFGVAKE